ncbi:MAG: NAD(P)/FAD-dependent oxidoreductase [Armatimonadota bacterium]
MPDFILIGNGIAANSAAQRIHDLARDARIVMVTDEDEPYYSRCALMYYVMDHCKKSDIYIADRRYYSEIGAELVVDVVAGVRAEESVVEFRDGGERRYDGLLIASGALPRRLGVPGEEADGVFDFVTLADADAIRDRLKTARRGVVIGGGLIGAEAVEVLYELGIAAEWLIREEYFYPIFCSRDQSLIVQERFTSHGVRVHTGRNIAGFEVSDDGNVAAVVDDHGESHPADIVIRSIGVEPNIGFLEGSGIETGVGVKVDDHLRTNVANVWAAGDCAELCGQETGRPLIEKLWYTAQPQGWVAGENMAGGDATYRTVTQYQSAMFMDLDFCSYGEMPAPWNTYEGEVVDPENGEDSLWLIHDGEVVVGASFLGTALTKEDIEHMVGERMPVARARALAERVLRPKRYDRAPVSRIAPKRRWSRRPNFWPAWLGGR